MTGEQSGHDGTVTFQAEVLEVVYTLRVDQLDVFVDRAAVVLAQVTFGRDVVVFNRPADKSTLTSSKISFHYFIICEFILLAYYHNNK